MIISMAIEFIKGFFNLLGKYILIVMEESRHSSKVSGACESDETIVSQ